MRSGEFEELKQMLSSIAGTMITKDDIKYMATKDDIKDMVTKDDIRAIWDAMATKDDIRAIWDAMATKDDLEGLRMSTKADIEELRMSTKAEFEELRYVTSQEMQVAHDSLKQSIDVLTDRVTMLEYKVDGAHNFVLDKKEYINRLPKMEDRLFALETVCREHTCQIGYLISAGV